MDRALSLRMATNRLMNFFQGEVGVFGGTLRERVEKWIADPRHEPPLAEDEIASLRAAVDQAESVA